MGGKRKRKQKVVKKKPTLPKTFECPNCGKISVSIKVKEGEAYIRCGSCGLATQFDVPLIFREIDAYGKFIDLYTSGRLPVSPGARQDEDEGTSEQVSGETDI